MPHHDKHKLLALIFLFMIILPISALSAEKRNGEWTQYTWYEGKWTAMGTFLVHRQGGNYLMTPREQRTGDDIANTRGLFAVSFTDSEWHFKSDWGDGHIGTFILNKAGPGMYYGWSYLGETRIQQNLWLLTK